MNVNIPPWLEDVFDEVNPGLRTSHQKAQVMRDDLYRLYRDAKQTRKEQAEFIAAFGPEVPHDEPGAEDPKDSANRIADMAPAIDDQNWSTIRRGITKARELGVWDNPTEMRLIARLNDEFEGAINEHRVQKSRITAFFDRLL